MDDEVMTILDIPAVVKEPPLSHSYWTYVFYPDSWGKCSEPRDVVQFNMTLFGTLMAASCVQMLLCAALRMNSSLGCICGTTTESQARSARLLLGGF